MNGYLIAEEGPLVGSTIDFEEIKDGPKEWVLGRDPDVSDVTLEDPMVSRRHVIIRLTPEGFILENLSSVNPAMQNGKIIAEPVLLREGDIIQIGNTFFRFTENRPNEEAAEPEAATEETAPLSFGPAPETRWLLKVISGPNAGAEFSMQRSSTYVIGKDPNVCDIVFQDLSVSRQHARLNVDENDHVFIEDLGSRNGVIVNGELISGKKELVSEDLVGLGTTSFLIIDRLKARETIVSPPSMISLTRPQEAAAEVKKAPPRDWKEMVIPKKHLVIAGMFAFLILGCVTAMIGLFKTQPILVKEGNEGRKIEEIIHKFPGVQYSFNQSTGKLFIMGHVLTGVEKQELIYLLKNLPLLTDIDDNVIIDEYVWQNMNAVLMTYPEWVGVSVYSVEPGKFVLRGYLKTVPQLEALSDYMNLNFPYLDRLENQVVVESTLQAQIQSELISQGLAGVALQLSNGEVVLTGRTDKAHNEKLVHLLPHIKALPGVRGVKNFVVITTEDTSRSDLSDQYQVTGYSKRDEKDYYVVINGRILGPGDILDGMKVTGVKSNLVLLEKDGVKYKINYNLQ
ncbi:MAG TPA: type III secretion system inner membrane ring subunit SctD [Rhabdochlamydiaceae bacterium]|nr:type III secretion system inner membrane ring subunit SctD [Rhabdochlamydiaceae bacterium]